MPRSRSSNSQNNYNKSAMAKDSAINYQNILLDNLDEPINITLSTPSSLNSLVTKCNTNFTVNDPHIKKYHQTALDYFKHQILEEVTQKIKKCNISKFNTPSTPEVISSLKFHVQSLDNEINFLRSELQEKNALVKSLVTSHILHENVRVQYKNVETNPRISPSKIIEFCLSGQASNSGDVTDFHINYEQIATKDAKAKHEVPSETNTLTVTDETKNNTKVNIQQEDISKKNDPQDGKRGINWKSLSSNDIAAAKTCIDSQSVGKRKDNKRVFIVGDSIIKHLNRYVIGGKAGNCNVYVRPSHGAKVRCMLDHVKPIIRDKPDHIIFHVGHNDIPSDKDAGDIAKSIVHLAMSGQTSLPENININIKLK